LCEKRQCPTDHVVDNGGMNAQGCSGMGIYRCCDAGRQEVDKGVEPDAGKCECRGKAKARRAVC
jgi:hypothetical protein